MEPASLKSGQFIAISPMGKKPRTKKESPTTEIYFKIFQQKKEEEWDGYFEELKIDTDDFKQACHDHYFPKSS